MRMSLLAAVGLFKWVPNIQYGRVALRKHVRSSTIALVVIILLVLSAMLAMFA